MAELVGLLVFVALAVAGGTAIAPNIPPFLGWLLVAGLILGMVAGLVYVGGVVFQLPMTWLDRTRLGRALSSDQAGDVRKAVALAYWGILIAMAAGIVALGHFVARQ